MADEQIDAVFRRIKPNCIGFHIWKMEVCVCFHQPLLQTIQFNVFLCVYDSHSQNDRIETVPGDQCGIFHDRDTYIVYAAGLPGTFVTPQTVVR